MVSARPDLPPWRALVRAVLAVGLLLLAGACATPAAQAAGDERAAGLSRSLNASMRSAGAQSGAEVLDLSTGATLYAHRAKVARIPASVEKLYTTATALQIFGPTARLSTSVLGTGGPHAGTWNGALYLRGGGDPTFGSAAFDRRAYGAGATVQGLVRGLRADGIRAVRGPILADASLFDSDEGTPATGNRPSIWVEGALSALSFNRGWADATGQVYWAHPALRGTTAAGAAVVRSTIAARFGLHPHLIDGSGLAYRDRTSPAQVVSLLSQLSANRPFRASLAIVGETGTLVDENRGTYAQGRCTGKTGTLSDVSNVVGYCRAAGGHLLAYAFLMNGVNPDAAHAVQDHMELAVARYDG